VNPREWCAMRKYARPTTHCRYQKPAAEPQDIA